jgi:lactoylglutathione lyase
MPAAVLNLIVLRSADLDLAARFYGQLGVAFARERHGTGPEHLSCRLGSVVLEIYPRTATMMTAGVRLGFQVAALDAAVAALEEVGAELLAAPADGPGGRRAIVADLDGHRIELTESKLPEGDSP